ncbi:hypothetical protein ACTJKT_01380 [Pseudomonas sp. 22526]|uniref:hypothetical protein n=1 Tax=Pseudomonas sp. 22526 TaxID=3453937 RepID=UPI003F86C51D
MSFEHVEKVVQVRDQNSANERLAAGWSLLAIVPGFDNGCAYTNFVLGKPATVKNTQAMTVTLDANAVEALSRYRQALSAFEAVGHGTDEGADLFLATERAAEDLGKQIAVLAPEAAES